MLPFPIRSEADAFRWVVIVGLAGLSIGILTSLTSSTVGALWGLLLLVSALVGGFRAWRRGRDAERRRMLLVAEGALHPATVRETMGDQWSREPHDVLIVVPDQAAGDAVAYERQRQDMEISLQAVKEAGARPSARVFEGSPEEAAAQAHGEFTPHEVVVATRERGSEWAEHDFEAALGGATPVSRHPLAR